MSRMKKRTTWIAGACVVGVAFALSCREEPARPVPARPVPAPVAEWPNFLGPDKTGMSPEKGINKDWGAKPPKELWRVPLGDRGFAGPSAADGKVFIIDHEGSQDIVRALDIKTGAEAWRFPYEDAGKHNRGFSQSTPVFDDGRLYTLSCTGFLHCLEARTGEKLWSAHLKNQLGGKLPKWRYAGSPLVDGDRLVVTPGGGKGLVAVFDKKTGRLLGQGGGSDTTGYATPVACELGGRKQYVIFAAKDLVGVNAATLERIWSVSWVTRYDVNAATPVVMGDRIFITSDYRRGCALVQIAGTQAGIVWENKDIQSHFSTAILSGGHLYSTTDPGRLVCMDPASGKVVWRHGGFEKGGLIGVNGTLIVCDGRTGNVAMVEMSPAGYKELGRIKPLGGKSWTAPIVADGKLIVRNERAIACLDLK